MAKRITYLAVLLATYALCLTAQSLTSLTGTVTDPTGAVAEIRIRVGGGRSDQANVTLHGSLYEYHRNTLTSANSFFNNAVPGDETNPKGGVEKPKLLRNVFGASAGGRLVPNRLFFFANYEGRRDAREDSVVRTVPSETLRQGIVQYRNTSGGVSALSANDVRTRIDPLGIGVNQAALKVLQAYPMPNSDELGDGLTTRGARLAVFVRGNLQNDHSNEMPQFPGQPPARST